MYFRLVPGGADKSGFPHMIKLEHREARIVGLLVKSQIYLPEMDKKHLKSQITWFARILTEKLLPLFFNIEQEADKHANSYYESSMQQTASDEYCIDPASVAETAIEKGLEHYEYLRLGRYNVLLAWHVTLYELFEQQVRAFLFKEMRQLFKLNFKSFCTNIDKIKKTFLFHHLDIEKLSCWPVIDELRLVCNVVKHGEGESANHLGKVNLSIFKKCIFR